MSGLFARIRKQFMTLIALTLSLFLGLAATQSASAIGTLDQQFTGAVNTYTYIENGSPKGQTFTAGITGLLDTFTIQLKKQGSPGVLNGSIYAESNGFPTGSPLATTTVAESVVSSASISTISFIFSAPVSVTAGTSYVFVVEAPSASTSYSNVFPFTATYNNYIMYFGNPGAEPVGTHSLYMGSGSPWIIFNQSFLFASYVGPAASPSSPPSSTPSASPSGDPTSMNLANTGARNDSGNLTAFLLSLLLLGSGIALNISQARARSNRPAK